MYPAPRRKLDRYTSDTEAFRGFLDGGFVGHLAYLASGHPHVIPMMYARLGDEILLHGSTGAGTALLTRGADVPASFAVTAVDGIVLARSAMHHSLQFRSAVVHGRLQLVTDAERKAVAFDALLEAVLRGRSGECRPANARELAATSVVALRIENFTFKQRPGGAVDDADDVALPWWAGVLPMRTVLGDPVPADDLPPGTPLPVALR